MIASKDWYKSKTVWLAMLQFAVGGLVMLQTEYPNVGYIAMIKSILDIGLRFVTEKPIK